jgi:twinkle protein
MKIVSSNTKIQYEIHLSKAGENLMPCPECTKDRKHKNKKAFSFNATSKIGYCNHCEAKFYEYKPYIEKKEYKLPVNKNKTDLTDQAVKWFESRCISQRTLNKMRVYSDMEYMPQLEKETSVICFPFYVDQKLVNIKHRDGAKNFKLVKDAELVWYNINALRGAKEIIITEGEIDCLSFIESGLDNCISVPNGASGKNLEYLDNSIDLFNTIEKIYIATDNDIKGIELRNELIRRFGSEKCSIVLFNDCKDSNEYLQKYGRNELCETVKRAVDIPVEGIINLNNYYDEIYSLFVNGLQKGKTIGFTEIDQIITWETSRLAVVTGIPGHGKSEMVDFIIMKLNILHGWKTAYFSPENYPISYFYSKLASKLTGKIFKQGYINQQEFEESFNYIDDNFFFIYPEDDMSIDNILLKVKYLVKKQGIKVLVIDPYNKVEHMRDRNESETEYISKLLDKLTSFSKKYDILVILVAHPRKMEKKDNGGYAMPTLYDINGSANFYNKCDYGLCVFRDFNNMTVQLNVMKVKFKHLGDGGIATLKYNYNNGRYENGNSTVNDWDNTSYLQPVINPIVTPEQLYETEYSEQDIGFTDSESLTPF